MCRVEEHQKKKMLGDSLSRMEEGVKHKRKAGFRDDPKWSQKVRLSKSGFLHIRFPILGTVKITNSNSPTLSKV